MPHPLPPAESECFFMAPIGPEGSEVRERSDGVLDFVVGPAVSDLGLTAVRADRIADPGQITLQVIEHVLGARAAVADLTGANPNVFYELAIRHTAKLPVVLIADESERRSIPFDIAQMRIVFFDHTNLKSAASCKNDIIAQLRRALDGSVDSPITTAVTLRHLEQGNAVERTLAQLAASVDDLAAEVRHASRPGEAMGNAEGIRRSTDDLVRMI